MQYVCPAEHRPVEHAGLCFACLPPAGPLQIDELPLSQPDCQAGSPHSWGLMEPPPSMAASATLPPHHGRSTTTNSSLLPGFPPPPSGDMHRGGHLELLDKSRRHVPARRHYVCARLSGLLYSPDGSTPPPRLDGNSVPSLRFSRRCPYVSSSSWNSFQSILFGILQG
jgi:hypothetical protein